MTSPQEQDPEQVARLQQQLADAEAQIAAVKAQLQGVAGQPGDQVARQPIVIQGGAVDQHGNPVDLAQLLGSERSEQLRDALSQLGLGNAMGGFGVGAATPPVAPTEVQRLADPPRHVPAAFRLAAFAWSWWEQFALLMGVAGPIALWMFVPVAIPAGFIAAIVVIVVMRGQKSALRLSLLKWGKVARVTSASVVSSGTYYSGVTYQNMRVPQARGWDVTRSWYSGPATTTEIAYEVDGTASTIHLRGLPYVGGVILASSRKPGAALCVSSFPYSVKPEGGQFVGRLPARTWWGIVLTMLIEASLVVGLVFSVRQWW